MRTDIPVTVMAETHPWAVDDPLGVYVEGDLGEVHSGMLSFHYDASKVTLVDLAPAFDPPGYGYWQYQDMDGQVVLLWAYSEGIEVPEHFANLTFSWDAGVGRAPVELETVAFGELPIDATLENGAVVLPATDIHDTPAGRGAPVTSFIRSPNPLQHGMATTLHFSLRSEQVVDLSVVDATGRRIATLASGMMAAGDHSIAWDGTAVDGTRVGSGVYFARLRAEKTKLEQRMLVLR